MLFSRHYQLSVVLPSRASREVHVVQGSGSSKVLDNVGGFKQGTEILPSCVKPAAVYQ